MKFFWIVTSVADIAADNPNDNKILLERDMNTLLINGKPAVINSLRKLKLKSSFLTSSFSSTSFQKIVELFLNLYLLYILY